MVFCSAAMLTASLTGKMAHPNSAAGAAAIDPAVGVVLVRLQHETCPNGWVGGLRPCGLGEAFYRVVKQLRPGTSRGPPVRSFPPGGTPAPRLPRGFGLRPI